MPTALVVAEAVLQPMGALVPDKTIAEGSGSGAIALGSRARDGKRSYVQYEIFAGGVGGRNGKDGASATSFHLSNGKIAPVEIIESELPTQVERFELPPIPAAPASSVNTSSSRTNSASPCAPTSTPLLPKASMAATPAAPSAASSTLAKRTSAACPPASATSGLLPVTCCAWEAGRRGVGAAFERNPEAVLEDVRQGYVSAEKVRRDYGVVVRAEGRLVTLDTDATRSLCLVFGERKS